MNRPGYTTICAYVPNEIAERVDQAAKERKVSRSEFVAVAIDRLLSDHADALVTVVRLIR